MCAITVQCMLSFKPTAHNRNRYTETFFPFGCKYRFTLILTWTIFLLCFQCRLTGSLIWTICFLSCFKCRYITYFLGTVLKIITFICKLLSIIYQVTSYFHMIICILKRTVQKSDQLIDGSQCGKWNSQNKSLSSHDPEGLYPVSTLFT